jgi:hypothetical protein
LKKYGGVEVYLHAFLTSAIGGGEWSAARYRRLGGHGGEEENMCPSRESKPDSPVFLAVVMTLVTELSHPTPLGVMASVQVLS